MKKSFDTFVGGVDFGFSGAASGGGLAFGGPHEGVVKPNEVARHGAGFEEVKEGGWGVGGGFAGILGPQLASLRAHMPGGRGKLTKAEAMEERLEEKVMPSDLKP